MRAIQRSAINMLFCSSIVFVFTPSTARVAMTPYAQINAAAAADPIKDDEVRGSIHMLSGSGGNIGVLPSTRGFLLVDGGIAVSRTKIETALRGIGSGPVRYVINTHWHWDHTDGNSWLRGSGASIIADRHAAFRLTQTERVPEWEHTFIPVPSRSRPNIILAADQTLSFGNEIVKIRRHAPGHTDGDMSVYFVKANVLATGDTFWNGMYPFIDYGASGGINGAIRSANINLSLVGADTLVIPGHGPLGNRTQLIAFRDMLVAIRGKVAALKARGMTVDQVVAAKPTASFDAVWGRRSLMVLSLRASSIRVSDKAITAPVA